MSVLNKVGKAVSSVGKFMGRYADEASDLADLFRAILPALPIGNADKAKVEKTINKLDSVADKVTEFLIDNPDVGDVVVRQSDVEKALENYLANNPEIIAKAIAAEVGKVKGASNGK